MRKTLIYLAALTALAAAGAFSAVAVAAEPASAQDAAPALTTPIGPGVDTGTLPLPTTPSLPTVPELPTLPLPTLPGTTTGGGTTPDDPPATTTAGDTTQGVQPAGPGSVAPGSTTASNTVGAQPKARCTSSRGLPDRRCTTGAVTRLAAAALCRGGYARTSVPRAVRDAVFTSYGMQQSGTSYALDHLVPLSLGGSNAKANLWPQGDRKPGFREKDRVEAYLRHEVCGGRLSLRRAQVALETDWTAVWRRNER